MEDSIEGLLSIEEYENNLLEKCEYLVNVGLWPVKRKIDYISWLKNFTEVEKPFALKLLDKFTYINDDLCNELFKESFIKAGQLAVDYTSNQSIQSQWHDFFNSCIICPVRGENPSLADSGYSYVQKARDLFGIHEYQFKEPDEALRIRYNAWANSAMCKPIIFVDDFIGSGSQFYTMWTKLHDMFNIDEHSHETLSFLERNNKIFYCALLGIESGILRLKQNCTNVQFCVSHIITDSESIFSNTSTIWSGENQIEGIKALSIASKRGGIPNTGGNDVNDWKGYCEQGLLLGIREGAPDATIGAIRWNKNGWQPLIKKG